MYLIWCTSRRAFWKPRSQGYTREVAEAGRYDLDSANRIVAQACFMAAQDEGPPETLIAEDAAQLLVRERVLQG